MKMINEAQGYSNEIIPKARGEAQSIVLNAEGQRRQRTAQAKGDAERFLKNLKEYRKAPGITKKRLYLEFAEIVLPKVKKYILDSDSAGKASTDIKFFQ